MNILRFSPALSSSIRSLTFINNKNVRSGVKSDISLNKIFKRNQSGIFRKSPKFYILSIFAVSAVAASYYYYATYIRNVRPPDPKFNEDELLDYIKKTPFFASKSAVKEDGSDQKDPKFQIFKSSDFVVPKAPQKPQQIIKEIEHQFEPDLKENVSSLTIHEFDKILNDRELPIEDVASELENKVDEVHKINAFDQSSIQESLNILLLKLAVLANAKNELSAKLSAFINQDISKSNETEELQVKDISIKVDKQWLDISSMSKQLQHEMVEYMRQLDQFKSKISENKELISENILNVFGECEKQLSALNTEASDIYHKFATSIDQLKDDYLSGIDFKHIFETSPEKIDANVIICYLAKKIQELESYHYSQLRQIIDSMYKNQNEYINSQNEAVTTKYNDLIKDYEHKVAEFEAEKERIIGSHLKDEITDFAQKYSSIQILNILESLESIKHDMKKTYKIENELMESEVRSMIFSELEHMFARIAAIQQSLNTINNTSDQLSKHSLLLKTAYSLRYNLDKENQSGLSIPLKPYIDSLLNNTPENDSLVQEIVMLLPSSAVERGIYTRKNLFERLVPLIKECKSSVYIGEQQPSPFLRILSFLHSTLRLKDHKNIEDIQEPTDDLFTSYAILDSISKSIQQEDLFECYKKMSLLKGHPRKLAQGWINDAAEHIETNNTVNFLLVALNNRIISSDN